MHNSTGTLLEHYEALINEYRADLERNLDLAAGSASDPFGALDRINRYLLSEIARLKVQLIDVDLRLAQIANGAETSPLQIRPDNMWSSMPVFEAGSRISIGAGVTTFGFHYTEVAGGGFVYRWSGPSTRSGLVALIDRREHLIAQTSVIKTIDPRITVTGITVDGEQVQVKRDQDNRLHFLIPAIPDSTEPVPTQIGFTASECLVISDVQPQFQDPRRVSFNMSGIRLMKHQEGA
jgi:hypothetical protein